MAQSCFWPQPVLKKNEDVDTGAQAMAGHAHWVAESWPEYANSLAFLSPAAACFAPRKSTC